MQLIAETDETPTTIYNPLKEDFDVFFAHDNEAPTKYTIHSQEAQTYPKYLADHIAKHLTHAVVMKRGVKTNYTDEFNKVLRDEVMVKL